MESVSNVMSNKLLLLLFDKKKEHVHVIQIAKNVVYFLVVDINR